MGGIGIVAGEIIKRQIALRDGLGDGAQRPDLRRGKAAGAPKPRHRPREASARRERGSVRSPAPRSPWRSRGRDLLRDDDGGEAGETRIALAQGRPRHPAPRLRR